MMNSVLVADDDGLSREFMAEALRAAGHHVIEADTGRKACSLFQEHAPDLVFSDLRMPDGDGLKVLDSIKAANPDTPVILVTAFGSVETAVQAMRDGAEDFIMKPISIEQIDLVLGRLSRRESLRRENRVLKAQIQDDSRDQADCIGNSEEWKRCIALTDRVARTKATLLIRGESGSGKEVIAERVHHVSERRDGPLIRTNCAVLQDSLLSSELFGHERGAFTGAFARKEGRFELADGGTLFLDEIGELPAEVQAKLLRVLESGEFERVGGKDTLKVDVRVVCATNRDLEQMIRDGGFREDLFYRLNVLPIKVPSLRERPNDIPLLAMHFLNRFSREYTSPARRFTAAGMANMQTYEWPGNVRELANVVQRSVLLSTTEEVEIDQFCKPATKSIEAIGGCAGQTIADMERDLILDTLRTTRGNKTEAAAILGVTSRTLSNKMRLYRDRGELPVGPGV